MGDERNDGATLAAGILNLLCWFVTGSIGLLEHVIASKRNEELSGWEKESIGELFMIGDAVLGTGYLGLGLYAGITAEEAADEASGWVDVGYWISTWCLTGVGIYASAMDKPWLQTVPCACSVQLNLAYTANTAVGGVI